MRLTEPQLEAICDVFTLHFLKEDKLWLFGSRVDDLKRGGDIDLYVETFYDNSLLLTEKKIHFLCDLKKRIGEQKIDLVINSLKKSYLLPIYEEAKQTGMRLL